jgi:predicted MPP superfamily phosphohydrolase
MAELVDALDSKSSGSNTVWVRFPLRAHGKTKKVAKLSFTATPGTQKEGIFFDLIISIGIVATLLPASILIYSSIVRTKSWEHAHPRLSRSIAGILLFGTCILLYGSFVEPKLLITTTQTIDIDGIEDPIRAVLVADFQAGTYNGTAHISRVVDRILSLSPDIILIAGDQVDNVTADEDETIYLEPLRRLAEAGIPAYAVNGNHEYGVGGGKGITDPRYRVADVSARVEEVMTELGIVYLTNDLVTTTIRGQKLALFGGDSYWAGKLSFDSLEAKGDDIPTIAIIHNPVASWLAGKEDVDLILAGHTHGGQIRFPFIGPLGRVDDIVPAVWYQGLHDVDTDTQLFVTSGTGETGTRARLFNPPEVVLMTLQ